MNEVSEGSPINEFISWTSGKVEHLFYHYEPWDGPDGEEPRHTKGGAKFQLAMQKSTAYLRMSLAGNQIGKTYDRAVEAVIMMTGELPYCFRFAEGEDSGIKRMINEANIRRWGRRSIETGEIIDHNEEAIPDGTWDCGNILGVGPYPQEKICTKTGQQLWVCTYKQARDDTWIELFKTLIPEHCLDKKKGTEGFSKSEFIFYLTDRKSIRLKTYEQGWERVESFKAWHIILDEEPPDRKYYTGCVMHAFTISFSFTPLRGMSWSYTDIYQNWLDGNKDIAVFHATKYDCPYNLIEEVEKQERQLKGWEREPKIYGRYSQQEGRPYYDFDLCKQFIEDFVPKYSLAKIFPATGCTTVKEAVRAKMIKTPTSDMGIDTWEIYEEMQPGVAYWASIDCAKGSDDPEAAQDKSCCYIFRAPRPEKGENEEWPVCVACLYTPATTETFAWLCLYGAIHYNFALLAPETKGSDGSAFHVELRDYPFWFLMTVVNNKTKKTTEIVGFDTNARTRTALFNKQRKYINSHEDKSDIPHQHLVLEQAKIIWLNGRPDHAPGGKSDCVVSWCIGLWVWEETPEQIRDNSGWYKDKVDDINFNNILGLTKRQKCETRPILGTSKGMDSRRNSKWQREQIKARNQRMQKRTSNGFRQSSKKSGIY